MNSGGELVRRMGARGGRTRWRLAAAALLVAALAIRLGHAWGAPVSGDEQAHWRMARQISLRADRWFLPLGSPGTNHPPGVLYVTALAQWLGGERWFVVRAAFAGLSVLGLAGLYVLAESLFGPRTALFALALASLDRHFTALAIVPLESPSVVFLVPWAMWLMRRAAARGRPGDWLVLGLVGGLGYWFSTVFLALVPALAAYLLMTGRLGRAARSPWPYAGLAVALLLIAPNAAWNAAHQAVNYERHASKIGSFGLSPRFALLYLGDVLICGKRPEWIVQHFSGAMYLPVYIPCHWMVGAVYLAAAVWSFSWEADERLWLLWCVLGVFAAAVTVLDAGEPWNEFTWASSTVFPAVVLTAAAVGRIRPSRLRRLAAAGLLSLGGGTLAAFLAGPHWGYFAPCWGQRFTGRMLALQSDRSAPLEQVRERVRREAVRAIEARPDFAMAWYFYGMMLEDGDQRRAAFARALSLAPGNPPALLALARDRLAAGQWDEARARLGQALAADPDSPAALKLLIETELASGRWEAAAAQALRLLAVKPEEDQAWRWLYLAWDSLGRREDAERALAAYAARHPLGPAAAYLALAVEHLRERNEPAKAAEMLERAVAAGPRSAEEHALAGQLFDQLGDPRRAVRHYRLALAWGLHDPEVARRVRLRP